MSVPVGLDELRATVSGFDRDPYLVTVDPDGRPRTVAVSVRWRADEFVMTPGARTRRNGTERPLVSLVWPPPAADGYTLIVDGHVEGDDGAADSERLVVRPTSAVLHRPATGTGDQRSGCEADCVPVLGSGPRLEATESTRPE